MRIAIIGSMQFADQMVAVQDGLNKLGHEGIVTDYIAPYIGKSAEEQERLKLHHKNNLDAIRVMWRLIQKSDAVLALNFDKHGIENYVGGNTFMELGFAHVLDKQIFLYNDIPDMQYRTEIEAVKPIVINGDLTKIPLAVEAVAR